MMSTPPNFGKICNKKIGNPLISMLRDLPGLFINLPLVTIMDPKEPSCRCVLEICRCRSIFCFILVFEDFAFCFHIAVWRIVRGVCLWFSYYGSL